MRYHVYAILIQDVKNLIGQSNIIVCHTLREGNQCANYFAKLGTILESELISCILLEWTQLKPSILES